MNLLMSARSRFVPPNPPLRFQFRGSLAEVFEPAGASERSPDDVAITRRAEGAPLDSLVYRCEPAVAKGTLVCVHGVNRGADDQFMGWLPLARELEMNLVAPFFPEETFPGYQRLERDRLGSHPDGRLLQLLDTLGFSSSRSSLPVFFFGYSGGAQFVHRLVLHHPGAAAGAIIAAAGWYTFPDERAPFPYGLADGRLPLEANVEAWLNTPLMVLAGQADTERDPQLRRSRVLDQRQGRNRVERAERWVAALRGEARRRRCPQRVELALLPGAAHSFTACLDAGLADHVRGFLQRLLPCSEDVGGGS